jgi:localization factor PodJL
MTAGAPWSVKGIDPKAREVAKDLARRSGMTLGEWLNRVILEDDAPEDVTHEAQFSDRPHRMPGMGGYEAMPRFAPQPVSPSQDFSRVAYALDRLADRIEASETRTGLAISGVEHSVRQAMARVETAEREHHALNERLARMEAEPAGPRSVEALRMLEDRVARIEDGERRSAQAVEQMGRQMLAMAEALNRRLVAAEQQSAGALEQVGGEIARIAGAVEARLSRAEQAQAESLERFGAEIGRITDRFSERLVSAEHRAAQAIDDVGQQVARVTERIEQRHERAAGDLAERIRESEARTARLVEEAHARLQDRGPASAAAAAEAFEAPPEPAPEPEVMPKGPFGPELFSRAEALGDASVDPVRPSFAPEDFEAARDFAPLSEPAEEDDVFALEAPEPPAAGPRPLSTREVIDQARAAARAQQGAQQGARARSVEIRAKLDRRQASGRMFAGFGAPRQRRPSSAVQTALMVAGSAAFLSVGAAGVVLMNGPQSSTEPQAQGAPQASVNANPRAAVAISAGPAAEAPARDAELQSAFTEALRAVEAGRPGGLAKLKAVADAGHAPAQFYLAQLYESGRSGVVQNMAEARRWTARAAESGEANAMHNLGLYYFRGEGGPQDLASAAQWFRKAAELGVVDSQYNLGLMYQSGSGVQKDPAEALKWFSLAADQGDGLARTAAEGLKARLARKPNAPAAG